MNDSKNLPPITIMFSPGQFSAGDRGHEKFVRRILSYASTHNVAALGGTEAAENPRNNTHELLVSLAPEYKFHAEANPNGEWILINHAFGQVIGGGFIPVIPAQPGSPASGGHGPRGIVTSTVKPIDPRYGTCHFGVSHYVTHGQNPNTHRGQQNAKLKAAIDDWGKQAGQGSDLVWHMADTNEPQPRLHPYSSEWLTCWEESSHFPGTEGRSTIDTIARRRADKRVSIRSARALNDSLLPLPVDHYSVVASYDVKPKGIANA